MLFHCCEQRIIKYTIHGVKQGWNSCKIYYLSNTKARIGAAEALGQAKYSRSVICLCRGCEAADYPHESFVI